jgi:hypothetical protein
MGSTNGAGKGKSKRGRKAIFTPAQKRVLDRMIAASLKAELRTLVKAL